MATRTKVRETIIKILYGFDMGNTLDKESLDEIISDENLNQEKQEFAQDLAYGVMKNIESIDQNIDKYLIDWDLHRIGYMERAIFRLGTYEIMHTKTNGAIIINELLSISKKHCDPKSTNFINGVLNSIFQDIKKESEVSS